MLVAIGKPNSKAGNTGTFDRDYEHVQIFEWNGNEWTRCRSPITSDSKCNFLPNFGGLVINGYGSTVVVGAATHDGSDRRNQGQVQFFYWNGSNWIQQGADLLLKEEDNLFGASIDINDSGDTVAIGSLFDNGNGVSTTRILRGLYP